MSWKLLALDVDGTLLTSNHAISRITKRAIRRAMEMGVHVTLATGRAYFLARPLARKLGLSAPLITHDGAYVASPDGQRVLFARRIPPDNAAAIVQMATACGVDVMVLHESFALSTRPLRWQGRLRFAPWRILAYAMRNVRNVRFVPGERLATQVERRAIAPPKLFLTGSSERLRQVKTWVGQHLSDAVRVTTSGEENLEIIPLDVSKASGLAVLTRALRIRPEEIIAIGDHCNDVEMIRYAGLGVAMGNAPPEVRREADFVTGTNDEDGVADCIRRFVLHRP